MASNYLIHHQPALPRVKLADVRVTGVKDMLGHYRNFLELSRQGDVVIVVEHPGEERERVLHVALITKTCVIEIDPAKGIPAGLDLPL